MGFLELIAQAREPGDDGLPETFYDDLTTEYTLVSEGSANRVSELQTQMSERETEIAALKARNYDLLMASSGDTGNQDKQGSDAEFPEHQGIDSLFG